MNICVLKYGSWIDENIITVFLKEYYDIVGEVISLNNIGDLNNSIPSGEYNSIILFLSIEPDYNFSEILNSLSAQEKQVLIVTEKQQLQLSQIIDKYSNIEILSLEEYSSDSFLLFLKYFLKAGRIINTSRNDKKSDFDFSLEKIFENKGLGVTLADFDGNIVKCNEAFASMMQYSADELCKMNFYDFSFKDDFEKVRDSFYEMVIGKKEHFSLIRRYIRKDGNIVWVDLTVTLIKDNEKNRRYSLGLVVDITEVKHIEDKLQNEQMFSLSLMNNTPDCVYFKDLDSKFIKANKSTLVKFGLKSESEIIGKSDFDFFTIEHAENAFKDEKKIIKTGQPMIAKDEKETWEEERVTYVSTTKMPFKNQEGKIIGTFGITRDITAQKEVELKLAEEKEKAELIYRLIPSAIFTVDLHKNVTSWNIRAEEITGYKYEEIIGKHCSTFASEPCDNSCGLYESNKKKPILGAKCTIKTKSGNIISISKNVDCLKDNEGNVIGGIESFEDVTERIESERIKKVQYQISEAVNSTPNISILYKLIHDVIRDLMPAENFYIALNNPETKTISFPYWVDEFDEKPAPRKMRKGLTELVIRRGEDMLVDKEKYDELDRIGEVEAFGEMHSIWLGIPLKTENRVIGVMVVQDYSNKEVYGEKEKEILLFVSEQIASAIDKKQSHEELEKYSEELKQLNKTKDKFFSIIAHDLKNPFITLLGFSDMLVNDYDDLTDKEILAFITDIRNSAKLSHELLENLLDWSRSQTGKISYEPHKFDIYELVKRNILLINPMAKTKGINLVCDVNESTFAYADYEMINTVIRNLISNAVKFTGKGGVIKIYTKKEKDYLRLSVEDNGVGMNKATLNKLFMLGEQYTTKGTSKETGTGLGLILCKEFIEQNHGEISAESKLNAGSTFSFTLPIKPVN